MGAAPDLYRIAPGKSAELSSIATDDHGDFPAGAEGKAAVEGRLIELDGRLERLQERLYAEGKQALLIVLQAMDAGGKDGTIRRVLAGANPQGCRIVSFKAPTADELSRDFLWRVHRQAPPKGYIGVFNRSHYEDVLVTRVHGLVSDREAERRFERIVEFERLLSESGTTILKLFLHISPDEQRERLQKRLDDPEKHWKFNPADLAERARWDDYRRAYEDAIGATSTEHAPWHVIPADRKWYRNLVVTTLIVETLERMDPRVPPPPEGLDLSKVRIE